MKSQKLGRFLVEIRDAEGRAQFCGCPESLPADVRCSALALSYNVSVGLFGGFAPLVATWLIRRTGVDMTPAVILIAVAAIILVALWRSPETSGRALR